MRKTVTRLTLKFVMIFLPFLFSCVFSFQAHAQNVNYTPADLTNLTQTITDNLVKTVAFGADHRPYESARGVMGFMGLDLGVELTAVKIPSPFTDALATLGSSANIPLFLPVPRLNIHKSLPFGLQVGGSLIQILSAVKIWGVDAQWNFITSKRHLWSLALRGSFTSASLGFINTTTTSIDFLISQNLGILFEPYVGVGYQMATGSLNVALPVSTPIPITLATTSSMQSGRVFIGLPITLLFLRMAIEYGNTFAGIETYGTKVSLVF